MRNLLRSINVYLGALCDALCSANGWRNPYVLKHAFLTFMVTACTLYALYWIFMITVGLAVLALGAYAKRGWWYRYDETTPRRK